jgi:hypothetical protein
MSSAYRSPQDQLNVIKQLAVKYNSDPKNRWDQIQLPHHLNVNVRQTWLPALIKLRKQYAVNAPVAVSGPVTIRASPHSALRVVFDLAHHEKTERKLDEIAAACRSAEKQGTMGFNQIKVEKNPRQMAVHLDVRWVSSSALKRLWTVYGHATA